MDNEIKASFQRIIDCSLKIADMIDNDDTLSPQERHDTYTKLIDGLGGFEKKLIEISGGSFYDTGTLINMEAGLDKLMGGSVDDTGRKSNS